MPVPGFCWPCICTGSQRCTAPGKWRPAGPESGGTAPVSPAVRLAETPRSRPVCLAVGISPWVRAGLWGNGNTTGNRGRTHRDLTHIPSGGRIRGQRCPRFHARPGQVCQYQTQYLVRRQIVGVYVEVSVVPGMLQPAVFCCVPGRRPADIGPSLPLVLEIERQEDEQVGGMQLLPHIRYLAVLLAGRPGIVAPFAQCRYQSALACRAESHDFEKRMRI